MTYYQFTNEYGERFGSCEVCYWDRWDCQDAGLIEYRSGDWVSFDHFTGAEPTEPADWEGWYWQACFPGCLPDGDPMGPYATETECMEAAQVAAD